MRTFQFQKILKNNQAKTNVYCIPIGSNMKLINRMAIEIIFQPNDVLIFNKNAIHFLTETDFQKIHQKKCKVFLDLLDGDTQNIDFSKFDTLICSSHKQYQYFKNLNISNEVIFLQHHADLRLYKKNSTKKSKSIVYVGEKHNAFLPESILDYIVVEPYKQKLNTHLIEALLSAKAHYAVRPAEQIMRTSQFKPPTKIANAVACQRPIIINENADGAQELLGSSYPYLVRADLKNANHIVEKVASANPQSDVEYLNALNVMRSLRSYFSQETITRTLIKHIR